MGHAVQDLFPTDQRENKQGNIPSGFLPLPPRVLLPLEVSTLISPHRPPRLKGSRAAPTLAGPSPGLPVPRDRRWHRRNPRLRWFSHFSSLNRARFPALRFNAPLHQIRGERIACRITGDRVAVSGAGFFVVFFFPPKSMKAASHGMDDGAELDTLWLCPADPGAVFSAQWQNAYL